MKFSLVILLIFHYVHNFGKINGYPSPVRPRPTEYKGSADLDQEDDESPFPRYPFQQYIQVRKTVSVEHVPTYAYSSSRDSGDSHQPSASHLTSASESEQNHDDGYDTDTNHYKIPILREEIQNHKKQEVYEEKGYSDADYDHKAYRGDGHGHGDNDHNDGYHSSATSNNYRPYHPRRNLHDSPDGTSTKLLEFAANNLYDQAAHEKGIYQAREDIYCPPVIEFDLSSKDMAMGQGGNRPRGSKPRLKGLGSKISCLKNKYFGREPFPKEIFPHPLESRHSIIEIPTFDQFINTMRHGIRADYSFGR